MPFVGSAVPAVALILKDRDPAGPQLISHVGQHGLYAVSGGPVGSRVLQRPVDKAIPLDGGAVSGPPPEELRQGQQDEQQPRDQILCRIDRRTDEKDDQPGIIIPDPQRDPGLAAIQSVVHQHDDHEDHRPRDEECDRRGKGARQIHFSQETEQQDA